METVASVPPALLPGLAAIAARYDALICDVWGVLHNGHQARGPAVEVLRRFRAAHGPVVLLTNAPRPVEEVKAQFVHYGVPEDAYDAIMTSGVAAREELSRRAQDHRLAMLHIGPERDRGVFAGLAVDCVSAEVAEIALCTGLYDDDTETPEDYRALLAAMKARDIPMLCANPDIMVQKGETLIYCAGAIARAYEAIGGQALYFGKPHRPIYEAAMATLEAIAGRPIRRPLAVGDGLVTDIAGANAFGIDALFIADGVHGEEIGDLTAASLARLFAKVGARAVGALPALTW
ncbi:MAG: TIGR01459 family HAD-type hydrolase [Alphaproteobacteria bacterium]|nr:TIGR01459 family HAD-type hydrolase [Alphaproteobacteria bacterium]